MASAKESSNGSGSDSGFDIEEGTVMISVLGDGGPDATSDHTSELFEEDCRRVSAESNRVRVITLFDGDDLTVL